MHGTAVRFCLDGTEWNGNVTVYLLLLLYLLILQMYFILAYMEKVGVYHASVFISLVQKLVWRIITQHWVGKKVEFHME